MEIEQTSPADAQARLDSDSAVVYLDVRSSPEFADGHPAGALNIPIAEAAPGGGPLTPNSRFLDEVAAALDTSRTIIVGCLSGGRSQRACELLAQAGYANVTNMQGGFGGARDQAGNVVIAGWRDAGLPVETGQPEGRSYQALRSS